MKEYIDHLPHGVREVKRYRHQDYVLVECTHSLGYRRNHEGGLDDRCRQCFGDARSTDDYKRPVKMLVLLKAAPKPKNEIVIPEKLVQTTLF